MGRMGSIRRIHDSLFTAFGSQGWWPVTPENSFKPVYHYKKPISEKQKLEICFGAILTQNTNWKNVEKAIIELNRNDLIDIKRIMKIKNIKLAKIIKSSGYHNQKAKKLKNFCDFLLKNYNGSLSILFQNDIKKLREELLSVNGIGPETADSMILYAAKKPIFVVDAYTKRVFSRFGCKEATYDELQRLFMGSLPNNEKLFNECHALIVELGKNICKKSPLCEKCPINGNCSYFGALNKEVR